MNELTGQLPEDVDALQALLREQARHYEQQLAERDGTIERLRAQINILLAKRFGASAEKVSAAQLGLFNEAELETQDADEETEATGTVVAAHRRGTPKRAPLPEYLPSAVVHAMASPWNASMSWSASSSTSFRPKCRCFATSGVSITAPAVPVTFARLR